MNHLIDTHVALWALAGDPRLSPRARAILRGEHPCHVSAASLQEIAVKLSIGKLSLDRPLDALYAALATDLLLTRLAIEPGHCVELAGLPLHHRDPFDRMLVAQSRVEGWPLITADRTLDAYDITTVW